jgi:hypothetical protein
MLTVHVQHVNEPLDEKTEKVPPIKIPQTKIIKLSLIFEGKAAATQVKGLHSKGRLLPSSPNVKLRRK